MRLLAALLLVTVLVAGCATNTPTTPSPSTNSSASSTPTASSAGTCASTKGNQSAAEPTVTLTTTQGDIRLKLFCDKTPITGQQIVKLVEAGCWDGTRIHRVVRGFMDQGGDPLSKDPSKQSEWGTGGPSACGVSPDTIPEEIYCKDGTVVNNPDGPNVCDAHGGLGLKHDGAGVWSMARESAPHTSGSQFFLTAAAADFLDGSYTVFGHTADDASTAVVVKINNLPCSGQPCNDPPQGSSTTDTPVLITKATIAWS
jgi:cyclophilin family peptidyl-prolyl cis-trans isomerase